MFKYLKYDFKENTKILSSLLMGGILISFAMQMSLSGNGDDKIRLTIASLSFFIGLILVVAFATIAIRIFWNEVHGNRGYLTFQTPKKMWNMVASKLILVFIWSNIYLLAAIFINYFIAIEMTTEYSFINFSKEDVSIIIQSILMTSVNIIATMSIVYLSISLSRVMVKNKIRNYMWIIFMIALFVILGYVESSLGGGDANVMVFGIMGIGEELNFFKIIFDLIIVSISTYLSGKLLDNKVDI